MARSRFGGGLQEFQERRRQGGLDRVSAPLDGHAQLGLHQLTRLGHQLAGVGHDARLGLLVLKRNIVSENSLKTNNENCLRKHYDL